MQIMRSRLRTAAHSIRLWIVFLVFMLPYLVIYSSALPRWQGRTVGSALLIYAIAAGAFWFSFSPKSVVVAAGSKLATPRYSTKRKLVERIIRILAAVFGVFFLVYVAVPFSFDVIELCKQREPVTITRTIRSVSGPAFPPVVFLKQSLQVESSKGLETRSYTLLYSLQVARTGAVYELAVLPRSRLALDYRELNQNDIQ